MELFILQLLNNMHNKPHSKEAKKKMSESRKRFYSNGNFPWNKKRKGYKIHSEDYKKQLSENRKGNKNPNFNKKHSEETKRKMSEKLKGRISWNKGLKGYKIEKLKGHKSWNKGLVGYNSNEKHWNWQGGKSFEPYSVDWTQTLRRSIRERDNYICQKCGKLQGDRAFSVHHIDYDKKNCNPENLTTLCRSCHIKLHNSRKFKEL